MGFSIFVKDDVIFVQILLKCLAFNKGSVGYRIRYIRLRVLEILFTERKAKKETDGISLPPFRSFTIFSKHTRRCQVALSPSNGTKT